MRTLGRPLVAVKLREMAAIEEAMIAVGEEGYDLDASIVGRVVTDDRYKLTKSVAATPAAAADVEVDQRGDQRLVEIPAVLRGDVERPDQLAGLRITRHLRSAEVRVIGQQAALGVQVDLAPLAAIVRVPRTAVAGRVVEHVDLRIPREVAPVGATATLPRVTEPRLKGRVGLLVVLVEGLELRADADLVVRAHRVHDPHVAAGVDVVRLHLAAGAAFTTFVAADEQLADDDVVAGHTLIAGDVGADRTPQLLARLGVETDHLAVEGRVEDLAFGVVQTAGLLTAAGLRGGESDVHGRTEFPLDHAFLGEIDDQGPDQFAHLRRRQADSLVVAHGVEHVVDQALE